MLCNLVLGHLCIHRLSLYWEERDLILRGQDHILLSNRFLIAPQKVLKKLAVSSPL